MSDERAAIAVRTAVPPERGALETLQLRASVVEEAHRSLILADRDAIELPLWQITEGRAFVAELNGVVAGFGVLLPRSDGDAELDGLFVEPAMWRNGVGARLVLEAEHRAKTGGATSLHVVANPNAEAFYVACGFTFAGEEHTRFGVARTMKKTLI